MTPELLTFQKFYNLEPAEEIGDIFLLHNIRYEIEDNGRYYQHAYLPRPLEVTVLLKIEQQDFVKANEVLAGHYKTQLQTIDKDYYLFTFTNRELVEIINKPDEWGPIDYQLAKKLLAEKGIEVTAEETEKIAEQRIEKLSKPENLSVEWVITGYIFALIAGIPGIIMGGILFKLKKTLPNGKRVYVYTESDREHGKKIFLMGIIIFSAIMGKLLWNAETRTHAVPYFPTVN